MLASTNEGCGPSEPSSTKAASEAKHDPGTYLRRCLDSLLGRVALLVQASADSISRLLNEKDRRSKPEAKLSIDVYTSVLSTTISVLQYPLRTVVVTQALFRSRSIYYPSVEVPTLWEKLFLLKMTGHFC